MHPHTHTERNISILLHGDNKESRGTIGDERWEVT